MTKNASLKRLEAIVGAAGIKRDPADRQRYGCDETEDLAFEPEVVVLPRTAQEVAAVLALASSGGVPVTPRGAGTGLSGGALPVRGGWVLGLERLDRIRCIDRKNLLVEAEAGVVTGELQRRVEEEGLFYPPNPASRDSCLLGGNIAEDAAGPRSCKYGSTRRWVLGLEAVLADGRMVTTGGANRKDVAGYDLTQLLVGSEGTLAVVTAATLRLLSLPAARLTIALPFADLQAAADSVAEIFRLGYEPAACELVERGALAAVARLEPVPASFADIEALLLLELDGDDVETLLERAGELGQEIAARLGGEPLVATDAAGQRRLWRIRERVAEAVRDRCPYKEADTVVPRSALADLVLAARRIASEEGLEVVCYGHAGDGNMHVNLLRGDLSEDEWRRRRDAAETRLFASVAEHGGSVSGEHGIGWTQRRFLHLVRSEAAIELMRGVKGVFDPGGILNPGKIFPDG